MDNKNIKDQQFKEFADDELKNNINKFTKKVNIDNKTEKTENKNYGYYSRVLNTPFDTLEELKEAEAKEAAKQQAKLAEKQARKVEAEDVETALTNYRTADKEAKIKLANAKKKYLKALEEIKKVYQEEATAIEKEVTAAKRVYLDKLTTFTKKYGGFHTTVKDGDSILSFSFETGDTFMNDVLDVFQSLFKF